MSKPVIFDFDKDINSLVIKAHNNKKVGVSSEIILEHPVLMTNTSRIQQLMSNPVRITVYDGVEVLFDNKKYPDVFGPNIDTVLFCNALKNNKELFKGIHSFAEMGVGSGMISKYISSKYQIHNAFLNDINKNSIHHCLTDLELPPLKKSRQFTKKFSDYEIITKNGYTFFRGDGIKFIEILPMKVDLIVCNPPYIPKTSKEDDKDIANFFEGTRLMRFLIHNFHNYSKNLVIIISSTSFLNPRVIDTLDSVKFHVLGSHIVPLKVWDDKGQFITDNKKWYSFLTSKNKTIQIKNNKFHVGGIIMENSNYKLHHVVYIIQCYV